jgi:hypothetical protein
MKTSSVDRIVGNLSDEQKTRFLHLMQEIFKGQRGIPRLYAASRSKTKDQIKILAEVNAATNDLRWKYGLENFDVPNDNVHVIKKEFWDCPGISAIFIPRAQNIMMKETTRNIRFAERAFRAMAQFKSYGAFRKWNDADTITEYRRGLTLWSHSRAKIHRDNPKREIVTYFEDTNEAVVAELTKRYIVSQWENPLFTKELNETREIQMVAARIGEREFLDEDVYDIVSKGTMLNGASFGHKAGRTALGSKKFRNDRFGTKDETFDMLVRAMFTGHMFEITHLLSRAYGRDSLRALAAP